MKKLIALLLGVTLILSLVACENNADKPAENDDAQISNPFITCDTLEDAAAISGFDMAVPDSIDGYPNRIIQAIENEMIQVNYENGNDSIKIRKADGTEDCSGDSNEYAENNEVEIYGLFITLKGANGKVSVASWINNGYAYSITSTTALDKFMVSVLVGTVSNGSSTGGLGEDPTTCSPTDEKNGNTQILNPFVECDTMEAAAAISDFDMTAPESINGYSGYSIRAMKSEMIQVTYGDSDKNVMLRKAVGTSDVSGDYNVYDQTNEVTINNINVTLKGNDDMVSVATWTHNGYSYSIGTYGAGLSAEAMTELVQQIG